MTLRLVTPPSARPVTVAEAKAHLRIEPGFTDEDALITAYIDAAAARLSYLNRAIVPATYALDLPEWADRIILPRPPLVAVTAVRYRDAGNALQTLANTAYEVVTQEDGTGELRLAWGKVWPELLPFGEPVTIEFTAGYATVPAAIHAAVLLMVGGLYENRSEVSVGAMFEMPQGVEALLRPFQIWTSRR